MAIESSPFDRPVSQEQLDARKKQGEDDPKKAEEMATASYKFRTEEVGLRKKSRETVSKIKKFLGSRKLEKSINSTANVAETMETSASRKYDFRKSTEGLNESELLELIRKAELKEGRNSLWNWEANELKTIAKERNIDLDNLWVEDSQNAYSRTDDVEKARAMALASYGHGLEAAEPRKNFGTEKPLSQYDTDTVRLIEERATNKERDAAFKYDVEEEVKNLNDNELRRLFNQTNVEITKTIRLRNRREAVLRSEERFVSGDWVQDVNGDYAQDGDKEFERLTIRYRDLTYKSIIINDIIKERKSKSNS
ncbi:MAG: hypothetical protein Q8O46_03710 [bacterium]|nr:hypothetical protein [bacterium]